LAIARASSRADSGKPPSRSACSRQAIFRNTELAMGARRFLAEQLQVLLL
jgi:hypothetical protein